MDPISVALITANSLAYIAKDFLFANYNALKGRLLAKAGSTHPDVISAIVNLEAAPNSQDCQIALFQAVNAAQLFGDPELLKLAQTLLQQMQQIPKGSQMIHHVEDSAISYFGPAINYHTNQFVLEKEGELRLAYSTAIDQLGSDKTAVRSSALSTLQQLAQHHSEWRQDVIDAVCRYLRDEPSIYQNEDRITRMKCQEILTTHLRKAPPGEKQRIFWEGMNINLAGAKLLDFDLSSCSVNNAWFDGAVFTGDTSFLGTTFNGKVRFDYATFSGDVEFSSATFYDDAWFTRAHFAKSGQFGNIYLDRQIHPATCFSGDAWFEDTLFDGSALFNGVSFNNHAIFNGTRFSTVAWFMGAAIHGTASFYSTAFEGDASFLAVSFYDYALFRNATFSGNIDFSEIKSVGILSPKGARARLLPPGSSKQILPEGWRVQLDSSSASGWGTVISSRREDDGFLGVMRTRPPRHS